MGTVPFVLSKALLETMGTVPFVLSKALLSVPPLRELRFGQ